ncbi:DUF3244 domain-containing protein [uncultured Bacteroides sp.]|uniref:DUF3244 domain-containing protein n=1 Tax=uncultured Bacteroides sp. TaxID=162156 RepID=UPI0025D3E710|nr:DUF3244 domain-containing protein [uncultured Bacteroides sp.]
MKEKLVVFMCIMMPLVSFAKQKDDKEQINIKVIERSWGEDKRSIPYIPKVFHDGNAIYIYSEIILDCLQVTILNEFQSIVYSDAVTIFDNRVFSFPLNNIREGEIYTIELTNSEYSLWGLFTP